MDFVHSVLIQASLAALALLGFLGVALGFMKKKISGPKCEKGWTAPAQIMFKYMKLSKIPFGHFV